MALLGSPYYLTLVYLSTAIFSLSVEDFNTASISQVIASNATDHTGRVELEFTIPLVNDDREEQKESLLLWLNASTSDNRDSVTFTAGRRCIRVDIKPDQDGKLMHEASNSSSPGLQ